MRDKERKIRQPSENELELLEMQRDAFVADMDKIIRKYCMTEDNIACYLCFPGVEAATVFTDLKLEDQAVLLMTLLEGHIVEGRNHNG